jgi:hypothetical protein
MWNDSALSLLLMALTKLLDPSFTASISREHRRAE